MFKLNDKPISIYQDLVIGEGDDAITHPAANLASADYRASLGIVEVPDQPRPDDRLYWVTDNGDGTYSTEPKALEMVIPIFWEQIKAKRDQLQEAGCPVAGYWFHNDVKSRTQWERMANRAAGMADADPYLIGGVAVNWKTMTGDKVPLTAGLIRQVVEAFEVREATIFATAEHHNAALNALATVEEVAAYDHSVGWPQSYA